MEKNFLGEVIEWSEDYIGSVFECIFEEKIDIPLSFPRWFEAPSDTVLFYFGIDPFEPEEYTPIYEEDMYGIRAY